MQREEIKPSFFIHCGFNGKTVPVLDKIPFKTLSVADFRGLASRKIGLPVCIFRLLNASGTEMYDYHSIDDYGLELGCTVNMETWDGWNEFLNLCLLGFGTQVMQHLSSNENEARFQMKVAMYIAAHFNHTDLAVSMLRSGIKADDSIGEHPSRLWCRHSIKHIDTFKTCVHEAAESGSLGVLRSFVHNSVMNVLAKDGNGLTPLNIALRKKQKPCASFLLTKQWSKISYTRKHSLPLSIYVKIKRWGERAKDKAFTIHGQWKSSLKNPKRYVQNGCLVGMEVLLDGYSKSKLKSLSENEARFENEEEKRKKQKLFDFSADYTPKMDPELYFRSVKSLGSKMSRYSKYGKSMQKLGAQKVERDRLIEQIKESDSDDDNDYTDTETAGNQSPDLRRKNLSDYDVQRVRFPPISQSVHELQQYGKTDESEFGDIEQTRAAYIHTGHKHFPKSIHTVPTPTPGKYLPSVGSRSQIAPNSGRSRNTEHQHHPQAAKEPDQKTPRPRKKARSIKSAVMVAQARSDTHNIPLPVVSWDTNPRPFVHPRNKEIAETLRSYNRMRGISSRDYAISCLSVASGFKEKPWLAQVQQAMSIASRGVKKTVCLEPHLFARKNSPSVTPRLESFRSSKSPTTTTTSETFMTA